MLSGIKRFDESFIQPDFEKFVTLKEARLELQQNWDYIERHAERHPSYEISATIARNLKLFEFIAKKFVWVSGS